MKYLRETTDWSDCEYPVANHIYIVEDGRMGRALGYIKSSSIVPEWFAHPVHINRKGRTFEEVNPEELK